MPNVSDKVNFENPSNVLIKKKLYITLRMLERTRKFLEGYILGGRTHGPGIAELVNVLETLEKDLQRICSDMRKIIFKGGEGE